MLYFRGPVLSLFDGREWTRLSAVMTPPMNGRAANVAPTDTQVYPDFRSDLNVKY
jgi:hypothetical protein